MKIYNSLTQKKEDLKPLNPPHINMYTCGVTVYDECHIGHARSLYIFDVMRRYLEYRNFKVNFVRNITDIDDKIINRANELKVSWSELVDKYIKSYKEDLRLLDIRPGIVDKDGEEPRATKNIAEIIEYIQALIDKGYAYATGTGVYFSVRKSENYGKLSGQSIDQIFAGVRKESDETKEDPLDFALWKVSKPGEPFWPSRWGNGRPGWHIECSVMSTKLLKTDTLDIHAGGLDLIFPHHENEIAQSEAKSGKQFAKYWIHHGLLTINGQKMSKSAGNFITIKDALAKLPYDNAADILKVFFLRSHYEKPMDFSSETIKEVKEATWRLLKPFKREPNIKIEDANSLNGYKDKKFVDDCIKIFNNFMDNDFNMPQALGVIFDLVRHCNHLLGEEEKKPVLIQYTLNVIRELGGILGLSFKKPNFHDPKWSDSSDTHSQMTKDDKWIKNKIQERNKAREEKDFKKADKIRKELLDKGIVLEDSGKGITEWRQKH